MYQENLLYTELERFQAARMCAGKLPICRQVLISPRQNPVDSSMTQISSKVYLPVACWFSMMYYLKQMRLLLSGHTGSKQRARYILLSLHCWINHSPTSWSHRHRRLWRADTQMGPYVTCFGCTSQGAVSITLRAACLTATFLLEMLLFGGNYHSLCRLYLLRYFYPFTPYDDEFRYEHSHTEAVL